MRRFVVSLLILLLSMLPAGVAALQTITSKANLLLNYNTSDKSWADKGLGYFHYGNKKYSTAALAELHVQYRYRYSTTLDFSTHMQVQAAQPDNSARKLGLVDWHANYTAYEDSRTRWQVRLGQFFLPTSMENIDRFWETPYSLNFSSLNSWIGEEFRPVGLDTAYEYISEQGVPLQVGVTLFGGNDSMGALLAYRGWSIGRHRTVLGDTLSLPKLKSLAEGGAFEKQRDDGTRPFGKDLDNRPGYAMRASVSAERYQLSLAWVDNLGDTKLHHGEYAWRTRFALLGVAYQPREHWEILAEASKGSSTMGKGPGVDIDFYSAYFMLSRLIDTFRVSVRYDLFGIDDRDEIDRDNNDFGRSTTVALMWKPESQGFETGLEFAYLNAKRFKDTVSGDRRQGDSLSVSLIASYLF